MSWRDGSPGRQRLAGAALLAAALTALVAAQGGTVLHLFGASLYIAVVALALWTPEWIVAQVLGGQALAAGALLAPEPPGVLPVALMVTAVIATAELLGIAARLDTARERDVTADIRRAAAGVIAGAAIFALVLAAARLPGPTGLVAVSLAAAACAALALLIVHLARSS